MLKGGWVCLISYLEDWMYCLCWITKNCPLLSIYVRNLHDEFASKQSAVEIPTDCFYFIFIISSTALKYYANIHPLNSEIKNTMSEIICTALFIHNKCKSMCATGLISNILQGGLFWVTCVTKSWSCSLLNTDLTSNSSRIVHKRKMSSNAVAFWVAVSTYWHFQCQ